MADKLPLVISAGEIEQLQSGDVLINQEGTVVYAMAAFATDNVLLRADDTGFGSQKSDLTLTDKGQLFWGQTPANVIIGYNQSGGNLTGVGIDNMIMGGFCGAGLTTGTRNMLIGGSTGSKLTIGNRNAAVGFGSLFNAASVVVGESDDNVAIGNLCGLTITTGSFNTFIGSGAGNNASQLATATNSMALGSLAFTTADNQVVLGNSSVTETILRGVVEGDSGTFVYAAAAFAVDNRVIRADGTGFGAQFSEIVFSDSEQIIFPNTNTKIGDVNTGAGITSGLGNVFLGGRAGQVITIGVDNMFIGTRSGASCIIGGTNVGVGVDSLSLTTSFDNVGIGHNAGGALTTNGNNVFIGSGAGGGGGQLATASNSIGIGKGVETTANNQIILGNTDITDTKIRGVVELKQTTTLETSGAHLPILSILDSSVAEAFAVTSYLLSEQNIGIGNLAGLEVTTATNCVFIGAGAGRHTTTGESNTYIGGLAGRDNITGLINMALGGSALLQSTTGSANTAFGAQSMFALVSGSSNACIGANSGGSLTTANRNVFIGRQAGTSSSSPPQATVVNDCIALGYRVGTTGSDAIVIGSNATASVGQIVIGNSSSTDTFITGITEQSTDPATADQLWDDQGFARISDGSSATLLATFLALERITPTSNVTLTTETLVLADATSGTLTVTLPPAADLVDTPVHVKKIDSSANSVIIDGNGSETIDGQLTVTITVQYTTITVVSNGISWFVI